MIKSRITERTPLGPIAIFPQLDESLASMFAWFPIHHDWRGSTRGNHGWSLYYPWRNRKYQCHVLKDRPSSKREKTNNETKIHLIIWKASRLLCCFHILFERDWKVAQFIILLWIHWERPEVCITLYVWSGLFIYYLFIHLFIYWYIWFGWN